MAYFFCISYLLAVVLQPAEWVPFFDGVPIYEIIIMLGVLSIGLQRTKRTIEVVKLSPSRYFLLYIFASIISVTQEGMSYAIKDVGLPLFKFYLGYLIIIVSLDSVDKLRKAIAWSVAAGILVGYFSIRLYHTGIGVGEGVGTTVQKLNWRGSIQWIGTFEGTNTTGQLLLLLIAFSLGMAYKEGAFFKKYFFLIGTGVIGYAFILTHSRGGFLGLLAVIGYFAYNKMNIRLKYFLPISLVLMIAVLVLKPSEEGRGIGESSTPERVELLHQGLQMFKNNPLTGVGAQQFARNNPIRKTAHNVYLNTLAETGFIGFFVFMMMYYVAIREIFRLRLDCSSEGEPHRVMQPIIMALAGFAVSAFFLSSHHDIPYITLAFMVAVIYNNHRSFAVSFKEYKYIVFFLFVFLAVVYALVQFFFIFFR